MNTDVKQKLAGISEGTYLRERLDPQPGDPLYLHLSDLRIALKEFETDRSLCMLDFGCGGSPYRTLFPKATYERADIKGVGGIDYEIRSTPQSPCHVPVEAGRYDLVLSSQVLEHVPDPHSYLTEAYRMLKPGGQLLLSTHGIFEDHGCPYDFRRWTSYGLAADLKAAGFHVSTISKLTTGPRAALFLLQQHRRSCGKTSSLGIWIWGLKLFLRHRRASFDRQCDANYADCRVVRENLSAHRIYIGLLASASKPAVAADQIRPPVGSRERKGAHV